MYIASQVRAVCPCPSRYQLKSLKKSLQGELSEKAINIETLYNVFSMVHLFELPEVGKAARKFLMVNWKELSEKGVVKQLVIDYQSLVAQAVEESVPKG